MIIPASTDYFLGLFFPVETHLSALSSSRHYNRDIIKQIFESRELWSRKGRHRAIIARTFISFLLRLSSIFLSVPCTKTCLTITTNRATPFIQRSKVLLIIYWITWLRPLLKATFQFFKQFSKSSDYIRLLLLFLKNSDTLSRRLEGHDPTQKNKRLLLGPWENWAVKLN